MEKAKLKEEASKIAEQIVNKKIKIGAKTSTSGKIFGSVNTIQLAEAIRKEGLEIDRKSLKITQEPIREVGTYEAIANLHKDVKTTFSFEVVAE